MCDPCSSWHTLLLPCYVLYLHQASHSLLSEVKLMVFLYMQEVESTNFLEPCLMHLYSCPDFWICTWLISCGYSRNLHFHKLRSYMLAKVNITLYVVPRNKIYTETLKWIPRTIILLRDLTPQSSSESTKASGMCASLTFFWFKRRHSSSARHQITRVTFTKQSCAWHRTPKKDFSCFWMQEYYSSKSVPEYQFRPLTPRSLPLAI